LATLHVCWAYQGRPFKKWSTLERSKLCVLLVAIAESSGSPLSGICMRDCRGHKEEAMLGVYA
jgi:hypothetical protein